MLLGDYSNPVCWSCDFVVTLKLPYTKPTFGLDKELLTLACQQSGFMMRAGDVVIIAWLFLLERRQWLEAQSEKS